MSEIRLAQQKDLNIIWSIYDQRYHKYEDLDVAYSKDNFAKLINDTTHCLIFVICDNDKPNGFILVYNMGIWGYIEFIVIDSKYRLKGYSQQLLDIVYNTGKSLGWSVVKAAAYKDMEKFMKKNKFNDNGYSTRWVHKVL